MNQNKKIVESALKLFPKINNILESTKIDIDEKEGIGNIVTRTDKLIENYLKKSLSEIFPDAEIVAEESENTIQEKKDLKFIIDPLDGTTNYTNSWPHTVSIGIIKSNELIGGIIYDVLNNVIYSSVKGEGVRKCEISNIANQIEIKRTAYLNNRIKKSIISYDTPYDKDAYRKTQSMCYELYLEGASLKTVGPISLDILKTALGRENLPNEYNAATWHFEVRAWDLAAATCILRELGGEIIGKDGNPLPIETLSDPMAKIAFIASGNKELSLKLYEKMKNVFY